MKIGIIDYGAGNLHSVYKAFRKIGQTVEFVSDPTQFNRFEALLLPGVGHFGRAADQLKRLAFDTAIRTWYQENRPMLGICLGMQLSMGSSDEGGATPGLGLMAGECKKLNAKKVPHIGWNMVQFTQASELNRELDRDASFYFVHSYIVNPQNTKVIIGTTKYEDDFPAIIRDRCFTGMQFHPEKSGKNGLTILKNWVKGAETCK